MPQDIDYGNLMHNAMRSLIRSVLTDVAERGLPGAHHFFITFDTHHPDAELADWLGDRYPGEMTVVLQHWFDNLTVTEDGFAVTLNFGNRPEPLYVPFDAIKTFVDPSVEFGLRFESAEDEEEDIVGIEHMPVSDLIETTAQETAAGSETPAKSEPQGEAEVVSLDSFRK